jgi:pentatricopeptide repeat protein
MVEAGIPLSLRAINGLMKAAKRCGKPELAHWYFHKVMPAMGIEADVVAWNTLLGAYGRNGHIDGAYDAWQVAPMRIA